MTVHQLPRKKPSEQFPRITAFVSAVLVLAVAACLVAFAASIVLASFMGTRALYRRVLESPCAVEKAS